MRSEAREQREHHSRVRTRRLQSIQDLAERLAVEQPLCGTCVDVFESLGHDFEPLSIHPDGFGASVYLYVDLGSIAFACFAEAVDRPTRTYECGSRLKFDAGTLRVSLHTARSELESSRVQAPLSRSI